MTKTFPLFDGQHIDLEQRLGGLEQRDKDPLKTDFKEESNPWWLSLETDNGSQSFDGLASGDSSTTTLSAGTTSTGDVTNLKTDPINWDNWSEIWFFAWGVKLSDPSNGRLQVMLSDNKDLLSINEGFRIHSLDQSDPSGVPMRVVSSGSEIGNLTVRNINRADPHMYGFRLIETDNSDSTGHDVIWYFDWEPWDRRYEDAGFPSATDLSFRVGVRTESTSADRSLTVDGMYLGLVP